MKKLIVIMVLGTLMISLPEENYDYNATRAFYRIQEYGRELNAPHVVNNYNDSLIGILDKCYVLMPDKKIHLDTNAETILLSRKEVKKLFDNVMWMYRDEMRKNPQNVPIQNYKKRRHYSKEIYKG